MSHQTKIVILDTGCANLSSVDFALQRLGYHAEISRDPQVVLQADKLLLPGVGTAKAAMDKLEERELISLIKACGQPVLGICLGMQLLTRFSEETNGVEMLGLIDTEAKLLTPENLSVPHTGWNQVQPKAGHHLFRNIPDHSHFYFVHSYAVPISEYTIAHVNYGGEFSAAIQCDNFYGVQFHPERSGQAGAQLLKNFIEL